MDALPLRIADERVTTDVTIEVRSPFDGSLVGVVHGGETKHLDAAVAAARGVLDGQGLPTHRRAAILDAAAQRLAERAEEFARTIAHEAAKPIGAARGEVARGIDTLRFSAAAARTLMGELLPLDASSAGEGKVGFVRRVPAGVVAAITPFNFPLNLALHKVGPALAAGCPVVLKPAPATPLSALLTAELFLDDCALPPGWLNVVPCTDDVAPRLVDHPDVAVISFTGSARVGWDIRSRAPRKRVGLELGNNSPIIIEADGDWRRAAAKIKVAGYAYSGQSCISVQRILVHEDVAEPFVATLVEEVARLTVGDPMDDATDVSSLIRASETERVKSWIDEAVAAGARVAAGGEVVDGILAPTVLVDAQPDMKVCRNEVFGPVVAVRTYTDFEAALAEANDTDYGLQAGVFTSDLAKALRASEVLQFGGVLVNEVPTWRADHMPYGGLRNSGNTREGPLYSIRELMTEERLIVLQP